MNKPRKIESSLLNGLRKGRDLVEVDKIRTAMQFSYQISRAIKEKGWTKIKAAEELDQKPSVISKWLSGKHNFTVNTLCEIGYKLGIDFFNKKSISPYSYEGTLGQGVVENIFIFDSCEKKLSLPNTIKDIAITVDAESGSSHTIECVIALS